MRVLVIYENPEWTPPIERALTAAGVAPELMAIDGGPIDMSGTPEDAIYLNRMSASAHTRGHEGAAETTRDFLGWLERHDRRVINGLGAFKLELSKARQIEALESHGFAVPRTSVVEAGEGRFGALVEAASGFDGAFVVKPNRGGKGLGVEKFDSVNQLEIAIEAELIEPSPDGLMLVQRYIEPADPSITRCEFVGGEFLYAIRADTSGGFELCPADGCGEGESEDPQAKFSLREDVPREQIEACEAFCSSEGIEIAGIEFIEDAEGKRWTYDVNCNTNYSPSVEANHGLDGAAAVAGLVRRELEKLAPS